MKVLITGIGDAFTRRYFGSSALIAAPEGLVLIDCPDLIHRALHEAAHAAGWNVDVSSIDDVLLTHLHGDHCNGLESLGFARRLRRMRGEDDPALRPRIHAAQPVADRVWERLAPAMDSPMDDDSPSTLEDYFTLHVLSPDASSVVAGLTVACRFTRHPVPTIGLLISDGGRTLGWSGDTRFDAAHIEWLSGADIIVHECNRGAAHASLDDLNALPDEMRRRMRLVHVPDDFDSASTDIRPLREGEVLEL